MFGLLRTSFSRFSTTIFDKILNKSIPSQSVYEDEQVSLIFSRFMLSKMWILKLLFIFSLSQKIKMDFQEFLKYFNLYQGSIKKSADFRSYACENSNNSKSGWTYKWLSSSGKWRERRLPDRLTFAYPFIRREADELASWLILWLLSNI